MTFSNMKYVSVKTNHRGVVSTFRLILSASLFAVTLVIVVSKQIDSKDAGVS